MSRNLFILGAGASAHLGTPLMNNFLEIAQALWRKGQVDKVADHFEKVFSALGYLQSVRSHAKIDTGNIETLYAALEMGKTLGKFPGIIDPLSVSVSGVPETFAEQIDRLITSLRIVIGYTLQETTVVNTETNKAMPMDVYSDFIKDIMDLAKKDSVSIVTFNYDLGLDYAFYRNKIRIDYALDDLSHPDVGISYLKLHGSLNWRQCANKICNTITTDTNFSHTQRYIDGHSIIPVLTRLKDRKCKHCQKELMNEPLIVPPTWNKTAYHMNIERVWTKAASELASAENIFIIGYSLPDTDQFFRYLYALSYDPKTFLKRFTVINTDSPKREEDISEVEREFRKLLGSGVEEKFRYIQSSFENYVQNGWVTRLVRDLLREI